MCISFSLESVSGRPSAVRHVLFVKGLLTFSLKGCDHHGDTGWLRPLLSIFVSVGKLGRDLDCGIRWRRDPEWGRTRWGKSTPGASHKGTHGL